jgi:hypothetical protein
LSLFLTRSDARRDNPSSLAGLGDGDRSLGLVAASLGCVLDLLNNIVTLHNLAEDTMFSVKPAGDFGGDEELGAWPKKGLQQALAKASPQKSSKL